MKFIASLLIASASLAFGQSAVADGPKRSGLTGGLSVGASGLSNGGFGVATELNLGFMLNTKTALYAEVSGTLVASGASNDDGLHIDSHTIVGVGAKQWLLERLWAKATVGAGQLAGSDGNESIDASGLGLAAAVGYGITEKGTLNIIGRGALGVYSEHTIADFGLLLGVQF